MVSAAFNNRFDVSSAVSWSLGAFLLMVVGALPWIVVPISADDIRPITSESIVRRLQTSPPLWAQILVRNALVAAALMASRFAAGIPAVALLLATGFRIGQRVSEATAGLVPPGLIAASMIPHGIFEMPAIWLSGGIGISGLPYLWRRDARAGDARPSIGRVIIVVAVLLTVGSLVEAFMVPRVIRAYAGL